jgi:hypothetical protein
MDSSARARLSSAATPPPSSAVDPRRVSTRRASRSGSGGTRSTSSPSRRVIEVGGGGDGAGEQDALERVELVEGVGIEEGRDVLAEQPQVDERLVALVGEVGADDAVEEFGVAEVEEQVELVAGVLGVLAAAGGVVEGVPLAEEPELAQGIGGAEREEDLVRAGGGVDELELAGAHVLDDEHAAGGGSVDAALLAEVAVVGEGEAQAEVAGRGVARRGGGGRRRWSGRCRRR